MQITLNNTNATHEVEQVVQRFEVEQPLITSHDVTTPPPGLVLNPNRVVNRTFDIATSVAAPSNASVHREEVVEDLSDLLEPFAKAEVTCRLVVKMQFIDNKFDGIAKTVKYDMSNVSIDESEALNFISPIKNGGESSPNGFLREPLIELMTFLNSCNAKTYVLCDVAANGINSLVKGLDASVNKVVYKDYYPSSVVSYYADDEEYDSESEQETVDGIENALTVSDLMSLNSWTSYTIAQSGTVNVNYTVCLSINSVEAYSSDAYENYVKIMSKRIQAIATKSELTTLSCLVAVALSTDIISTGKAMNFIDSMIAQEEEEDPYELTTFNYTYRKMQGIAEMFEADVPEFGILEESDEFLPSKELELEKFIAKNELMYAKVVLSSMDAEDQIVNT